MTTVNNKNIPPAYFELFLELAKHGSFTKTAQAIGVSKAAISHSIKKLELELKVDFINRTTRFISLTHEGKLLLEHCRSLQTEIDNIRDLSRSFHIEPSGTLKISSNPFFADEFLLSIISKYTQRFPKVSIKVSIEEKLPDFNDHQIDLVFGVNWPPPEDIVARKISSTRYVLCASPEYIKKYGSPRELEELSKHSYINHNSRNTHIVGQKKDITLKGMKSKISADNSNFIKKCVLYSTPINQTIFSII